MLYALNLMIDFDCFCSWIGKAASCPRCVSLVQVLPEADNLFLIHAAYYKLENDNVGVAIKSQWNENKWIIICNALSKTFE